MSTERWQRVESVLRGALACSAEGVPAYLDASCEGDPSLREEVERLLTADAQAGDFISEAIQQGAQALVEDAGDRRLGQTVGPYRLARRLGRGGMSDVYLAERVDDHFDQTVAVKLVRGGMDSEDILRRIRSERQILASLDHPNIAKLHDGGTTDDGLPYFVMEYIDGEPIDTYCDRRNLSLLGRLRLFGKVCTAVGYAHRNLVVHRDLKPSNVLVTTNGTVKLLDFGIAKLLDPARTRSEESTALHLRPMTPGYASPEQMSGATVTTATDVYSLGVLLYVLLTGRRPFHFDKKALLPAIVREVEETEPDPPSVSILQRVNEHDDPLLRAQARGERPEVLARKLRGDLDTIVSMALRKEPERRYGTADQLADDLRNHLEGRPVTARPNTVGYRAAKFVRRHWIGVTATVGVLILTGIFVAAMARQAARTSQERDHANQVAAMLAELFAFAGPGGGEITARELLDQGAAQIEALEDRPETQAMLMNKLGELYEDIGAYSRAEELFERALNQRRRIIGHEDPITVASLHNLARVHARQGRYQKAEGIFRETLDVRRRLLPGDDPAIAESLNSLALVLHELGRYEEAEPLYHEAVAFDVRVLGEEARHTLLTRGNLALLLQDEGFYERAAQAYRDLIAIHRRIGDGESQDVVAEFHDLLGQTLHALGRLDESEENLRRGLEMRRQQHGEQHPLVARSLSHLGALLRDRGMLDAAEPMLRTSLDQRRRLISEDSDEVAESLDNLGQLLAARGDHDAADHHLSRAVELYRQRFSDQHPMTGRALASLGRVRAERGDCARAMEPLRAALERLPHEEWRVAPAQRTLATCLAREGEHAEAAQWLDQSIEGFAQRLGPDHPTTRRTRAERAALTRP